MPDQVPDAVKQKRYRAAMKLQQKIALEIAQEQVGRELLVLTDSPHEGRTFADAPDVDCKVIFSREIPVGRLIPVRITGTQGYDLIGEPV